MKAINTALEPVIGEEIPEFLCLRPAKKGLINAAHWGAFEAVVENSRMQKVYPVVDDPYSNELIDMAPHQVHAKNRIKYSMIRKSWLDGGPGTRTDLRGKDEWVRVSWEDAIKLVSNEIKRLQESFGPGSIHGALMAGRV